MSTASQSAPKKVTTATALPKGAKKNAPVAELKRKARRPIDERPTAMPTFEVGKSLKQLNPRAGPQTKLVQAAIIDYLMSEVVHAAIERAEQQGHKTISILDVIAGIKGDAALHALFDGVVGHRLGKVGALSAVEQAAQLEEAQKDGEDGDDAAQ